MKTYDPKNIIVQTITLLLAILCRQSNADSRGIWAESSD